MNNNHCRFLFVLFKARIIGIASSSASCKKGGIYSYKVEVTFAIDSFFINNVRSVTTVCAADNVSRSPLKESILREFLTRICLPFKIPSDPQKTAETAFYQFFSMAVYGLPLFYSIPH